MGCIKDTKEVVSAFSSRGRARRRLGTVLGAPSKRVQGRFFDRWPLLLADEIFSQGTENGSDCVYSVAEVPGR